MADPQAPFASTSASAYGRVGSDAPEPRDSPVRSDRGIGQLLRDLTHDMGLLFRQEVALAKAEVKEKTAIFSRSAAVIAAGGAMLLAGFLVLLGAVAWGLAMWMDSAGISPRVYAWLAPLIVAAVVLTTGAVMGAMGLRRIKDENLAPHRTAQSLKDTKEWMKEKVT
jgi:fatty acid desaturase